MRGFEGGLAQVWAEGVGESDVGHEAVAEEGGDAGPGAVYYLVGDYEVERPEFFFEAADGADGDNALHAEGLEGVDVGADGNLGWGYAVDSAVPGQEGYADAFQASGDYGVAGVSEGGRDFDLLAVGEAGDVVESGAAYESESGFSHVFSPSP